MMKWLDTNRYYTLNAIELLPDDFSHLLFVSQRIQIEPLSYDLQDRFPHLTIMFVWKSLMMAFHDEIVRTHPSRNNTM